MNKNAISLIRLIALTLLIAMSLSLISCEMVNSIINGEDAGQQNDTTVETPGDEEDKQPEDEQPEEEHTHVFIDGVCRCGETDPNFLPSHEHNFVEGKCECGESDPSYVAPHEHNFVDGKCECGESDPDYVPEIKTITIAEAIALCQQNPEGTTERYYIRATVKTISNPTYGEMIIEDETGELYVYGTYSYDGSLKFSQLDETPVKGDEVLLHCILSQYNGENQVKNARLIEFTHNEVQVDVSDYLKVDISEARDLEAETLVRVSGVVAQITYANGKIPSGVILVDGTSSIYVYDGDIAGQVQIGNTIEIAGRKTYWILADEINNAGKYGYQGACQIDSAILVSNDKQISDYDKSWIEATTVKDIMDTPVSENITNKIFCVTALVKKVPGNGFVNYYIDDLDGITGSYVYTQCNGSDFGWLDKFDGKICTVYLVAINAKSTTSGCNWRFLPVEVIDEGYQFDTNDAAEYSVIYHGIPQFLTSYTGNPELTVITSVSSELLGFEGAIISYSSSDESVAYFSTDAEGNLIFNCVKSGVISIEITGSYGDVQFSQSIEITVDIAVEEIEHITVSEAINAENNSTVTVKGIVGPSLVNKVGFYLIDESGAIPVQVSKDVMETIELGYEVIVSGTRTITKDGGGQICIDSAAIVANYYGSNDYSTDSFITGKTIPEINSTPDSAEATTNVYVTTAKIYVNETQYSVTIQLQDPDGSSIYVLLYSGGKDQYNWLKGYAGETITVELALCDWNAKGLKGCVLAVVNDDGSKVYNTLNFN